MTFKNLLKEAKKLSPSQREVLADQILASVEAEGDDEPVSKEVRAELDRRWAEHKKNPRAGYSWEELKKKMARLRKKKRA